jgi:L-amino acid N-acyltransferase YncA
MTTLAIRAATVDDIPAITHIYADAVLNGTASFELAPRDEAEARGFRQMIAGIR